MRHHILKLLGLAAIFILLFIGQQYISSIVRDRISYRDAAVANITQGSAGQQHIATPILVQECSEAIIQTENGKRIAKTRKFQVLHGPDSSTVVASSNLQPRQRGIFKANTYQSKIALTSVWNADKPPANVRAGAVCQPPKLVVSVSDARGLLGAQVTVNGKTYPMQAGALLSNAPRGIHAVLPGDVMDSRAPVTMQVDLQMAGTQALGFVPLAENNHISLTGNWPHPAFAGNLLPIERSVNDKGFTAEWKISALASSAFDDLANGNSICGLSENDAQAAAHMAAQETSAAVDAARDTANSADISTGKLRELNRNSSNGSCVDTVGVRFIDPVDPYTLSDRASKYAMLFVILTFVAVGMVEILQRLRVHPVQYLLVGSALSVFFLLLISLSEHLGFNRAYALAAVACILLLTYYAAHILAGWKRGLVFGMGMCALYGLLYVLLQLEQAALLAGSLALFMVLAGIMLITRKINWYEQLATPASTKPAAPPKPVQVLRQGQPAP